MQVKSIAECSKALLSACIKVPHDFKTFVLSILSGRLRQVPLYNCPSHTKRRATKPWSGPSWNTLQQSGIPTHSPASTSWKVSNAALQESSQGTTAPQAVHWKYFQPRMGNSTRKTHRGKDGDDIKVYK